MAIKGNLCDTFASKMLYFHRINQLARMTIVLNQGTVSNQEFEKISNPATIHHPT